MGYYELEFAGGVWNAYEIVDDIILLICAYTTRDECIIKAEAMGYTWGGA